MVSTQPESGWSSLVRYAGLAPSSHNTQPWRFELSDDAVLLYADRTRSLPENDPDGRELTISCGCALMNLRVAAAGAGIGLKISLLPDPGNPDLLAEVNSTGEAAYDPAAALLPCIERRRTYRKPFKDRAIPSSVVLALTDSAVREGARIEIVEEDTRDGIAALVEEGDRIQWANPKWRRELASWMLSRQRGEGLAVPGLVGPFVRSAVRSFNLGKRVGAADTTLLLESPLVAVLVTEHDDKADWLQAGQALESVLLSACVNGMQASYLNQPIQVPSLRSKLQQLIGTPAYPQILLRLGFPSRESPASPRRKLQEITYRN